MLQGVVNDAGLTCVWLIPQIQVPGNGGVIIELLIGAIAEETLAALGKV